MIIWYYLYQNSVGILIFIKNTVFICLYLHQHLQLFVPIFIVYLLQLKYYNSNFLELE